MAIFALRTSNRAWTKRLKKQMIPQLSEKRKDEFKGLYFDESANLLAMEKMLVCASAIELVQ